MMQLIQRPTQLMQLLMPPLTQRLTPKPQKNKNKNPSGAEI